MWSGFQAGSKRCRTPRAKAGDARLAVASNPMAIGASFMIGLSPVEHIPESRTSPMPTIHPHLTRRGMLLAGAASLLPSGLLFAATEPLVTVHKDPDCGCCSGWVQHLQRAGFPTKVLDTKALDAVKAR